MTLRYRSVDLSQFGMKLQLVQGFREGGSGLSVRGKDYVIPHRRGRVAMPRIADTRTLLIEGWVTGDTIEDWRDATDLFNSLFDPELDPGTVRVVGPYLGVAIGEVWSIEARVLNSMPGPILGGGTMQHWSVELESVDPDWTTSGSGS